MLAVMIMLLCSFMYSVLWACFPGLMCAYVHMWRLEDRSSAPCLLLLPSSCLLFPFFLHLSLLSDKRSPTGTLGSWVRISQRQLASKVPRNCLRFCHPSSAESTSTHFHTCLFTWMLGIELRPYKLVSCMCSLGKMYSNSLPTFLLFICLTKL